MYFFAKSHTQGRSPYHRAQQQRLQGLQERDQLPRTRAGRDKCALELTRNSRSLSTLTHGHQLDPSGQAHARHVERELQQVAFHKCSHVGRESPRRVDHRNKKQR